MRLLPLFLVLVGTSPLRVVGEEPPLPVGEAPPVLELPDLPSDSFGPAGPADSKLTPGPGARISPREIPRSFALDGQFTAYGGASEIRSEVFRLAGQMKKDLLVALRLDLKKKDHWKYPIILQLNERLAQFIAALEYQRLLGPEARVARCVAQLFNPLLYPGVDPRLSISQTELGYLTGLSRQRVNAALRKLDAEGLLRVEYSGVTVVSLDGLRRFGEP